MYLDTIILLKTYSKEISKKKKDQIFMNKILLFHIMRKSQTFNIHKWSIMGNLGYYFQCKLLMTRNSAIILLKRYM